MPVITGPSLGGEVLSLCVDQAQEPDLLASRFSGGGRDAVTVSARASQIVSFGWDGPDGTRNAVGAVSLPVTRRRSRRTI